MGGSHAARVDPTRPIKLIKTHAYGNDFLIVDAPALAA